MNKFARMAGMIGLLLLGLTAGCRCPGGGCASGRCASGTCAAPAYSDTFPEPRSPAR